MLQPATLARPYAKAVFMLAKQHDTFATWHASLHNLAMLTEDPRVQHLIRNDSLSTTTLNAFYLATLKDYLSEAAQRLVAVLAANARLGLLPAIFSQFSKLVDQHQGMVRATLLSARPLGKPSIQALETKLGQQLGQTVSLSADADPKLLGGSIVQLGDRVIDATFRGQLNTLREQLIQG